MLMFGVFIHRSDSIYDDHPSSRYQFPPIYLKPASKIKGDWILYYEPTKVKNSRGYYATARVENIIEDPTTPGMFLALITPRTYCEFPNPVPFKIDNRLLEEGLYNDSGNISGRSQAAVRPISEADYYRILDLGLQDLQQILPRDINLETQETFELEEQQADFTNFEPRKRQSYTVNRKVRDAMFRSNVLAAYEERCAFTGLRIINGGGRAEVEAAHIRPVENDGPDSVQNGLALSGTVHWMFDRGLLSLADNMEIMVSRHINDRDSVDRLIQKSYMANVPSDPRIAPHPEFLKWHRDNCFKV